MNAPDISNADFAALLEAAESKFDAWHLKELRPERDRRISELKKQNLTSGLRAVHAFQIYRELLERGVRRRVGFYRAVARKSRSAEMLSKSRLDEYRQRIMTSVGHATAALKDRVEEDAHAGDWPESALPNEHRYVQLQAEILDVVNSELRVLEAEGNVAAGFPDRSAARPYQGFAEGAMPTEDPFNDPAIQAQIQAAAARIEADWLEWNAEPSTGNLDDKIVERLVALLNAHARGYLNAVNTKPQITEYLARLRDVGECLVRREREHGLLSNPYSEDRLRAIAESAGKVIRLKITGPPEAYAAALESEIEQTRTELREEAMQRVHWRTSMFFRIDSRFEARYRYWEAEAIEQVQRRTDPPATTLNTEKKVEFQARNWDEVKISFFNEHSVQITVGQTKVIREFGPLGMAHKRSGKPTLAWQTLHLLARLEGVMNSAAGKSRDWNRVEKRMQEIRSWLREQFGISSDPLPFIKGVGYRASFQINCAPSYQP